MHRYMLKCMFFENSSYFCIDIKCMSFIDGRFEGKHLEGIGLGVLYTPSVLQKDSHSLNYFGS